MIVSLSTISGLLPLPSSSSSSFAIHQRKLMTVTNSSGNRVHSAHLLLNRLVGRRPQRTLPFLMQGMQRSSLSQAKSQLHSQRSVRVRQTDRQALLLPVHSETSWDFATALTFCSDLGGGTSSAESVLLRPCQWDCWGQEECNFHKRWRESGRELQQEPLVPPVPSNADWRIGGSGTSELSEGERVQTLLLVH